MGKDSKIEWTDHTFNPWIGCTKVSPGCEHCYAEAFARRYGKAEWGPTAQRVRTSAGNWRKPLLWNKAQWQECTDCGWRGPVSETHDFCPTCDGEDLHPIRQRVFCASLADVFEDSSQLEEWRIELFAMMESTPNLDWLLLTKRPRNINDMVPGAWRTVGRWPANVWVGVSVENQAQAMARIPALRWIPAPVKFLSCEPLLGPLNLRNFAYKAAGPDWTGYKRLVDWIIVGGESGPHARPMHPDWARSLLDQCQATGIAFHYKQHGAWVHESQVSRQLQGDLAMSEVFGTSPADYEWLDGSHSIRLPKSFAGTGYGRQLDGRTWNEYPEPPQEDGRQ